MAESLRRAVRIANCSGFYGDGIAAAREMLARPDRRAHRRLPCRADHADPLEGKQKDDSSGYATTFLRQLEEVPEDCPDRGIKIVVNAGGLNPAGLADRVRQLAARLGLTVQVGYITGDGLLPRIGELQAAGHPLAAGALAASVTLAFRLCAALPRSRGSSGRW